jgi:mannose-1-phosphate guanylyltransferase/mannose-6-phosphate isomerase
VQSDGPLVVGLGLDNMIAIGTRDAILVAPKSRSQDVKKVVDALAALGRGEAKEATRVFKPWGWHEIVRVGPGFQVQEIAVIPGGRRPQECHTSRVSHWICTAGRGAITRGGEHIEFRAGMAFDFPTGVMHGLENPDTGMMHIIEVLVGGDSGDDIGMP